MRLRVGARARVRLGWVGSRAGAEAGPRAWAQATARVRRLVQQQPARARLIMLKELACGLVPAEPTAVEVWNRRPWRRPARATEAVAGRPVARSPLLGVSSRPEPPSRCAPGRRRSRARARPEEAFDIAGAHCNVHVVQPALAVAHLAVAIACDAANRRRVRSTGRVAAACWACSSPRPSAAALITRCGT